MYDRFLSILGTDNDYRKIVHRLYFPHYDEHWLYLRAVLFKIINALFIDYLVHQIPDTFYLGAEDIEMNKKHTLILILVADTLAKAIYID